MTQVEGIKFNAAGVGTNDSTGTNDSSKFKWTDILNIGSKVYTDTLKSQTDASNAQAAVQLEKLKIQQQQAANAGASNVTNNIKAYGVPLAIGGIMIIGGIAAYFYFKKKKA
jgi:LPXTG-motif cell wall-anchored protein